ncbi:MAG TPA: hypothetical protein VJH88_02260 [Candidatus Nanoarchaeia archaeon]|nr:hypothetical protein [Candidatus Nanoarchaeia archaeon]
MFAMKSNVYLFSLRELLFVLVTALITSGVMYLSYHLFPLQSHFLVSLSLLVFGVWFILSFFHDYGRALTFFTAVGFFTLPLNDFGATGFGKIVMFALAGVVFECVLFFFAERCRMLVFARASASVISSALLPLLSALVLSPASILTSFQEILNLVALASVTALVVSFISSLVVPYIKRHALMLKLEAYVA